MSRFLFLKKKMRNLFKSHGLSETLIQSNPIEKISCSWAAISLGGENDSTVLLSLTHHEWDHEWTSQDQSFYLRSLHEIDKATVYVLRKELEHTQSDDAEVKWLIAGDLPGSKSRDVWTWCTTITMGREKESERERERRERILSKIKEKQIRLGGEESGKKRFFFFFLEQTMICYGL